MSKHQNPSPLQLSCKSTLNPTSAHCLHALVSMNCSGQCGVGDVLSHQYLLQTQLLCRIWPSSAFPNSKIKPLKGQVPGTRGRVLLLLTEPAWQSKSFKDHHEKALGSEASQGRCLRTVFMPKWKKRCHSGRLSGQGQLHMLNDPIPSVFPNPSALEAQGQRP